MALALFSPTSNLKGPGIDRYKELVQKRGGEVLQSWLSCFSFKGEIDETQTKWTSKNHGRGEMGRGSSSQNEKHQDHVRDYRSSVLHPKAYDRNGSWGAMYRSTLARSLRSAVRTMSYPETRFLTVYSGTPYQLDAVQDRKRSL
jgi:hypothetical protein